MRFSRSEYLPMKSLPPLTRLAAGAGCAAIALLFNGCATTRQYTPTVGGEMILVEYDNVWITGSHIPVRVPRSPTARIAPTISPIQILTADDVRRLPNPPMH